MGQKVPPRMGLWRRAPGPGRVGAERGRDKQTWRRRRREREWRPDDRRFVAGGVGALWEPSNQVFGPAAAGQN